MMLERGARRGGKRGRGLTVKMAHEIAFTVGDDAVAQNKIVHATAYVDRVDLHVTKVSEGGGEVGRGLGEQKRAVDEAAGFGRSEFQRGPHTDQKARIAAQNKAGGFAGRP